ncbi:MAG TPA: diaminopimelate epimerase [Lachnospiraceae bacterium]|nr:diaminopimelate epimerase [Lachnospiraceae bacterium]
MKFVKMEGCGNDYIYVDGSKEQVENKPEVVRRLSDRHYGIGGDGVIFINPSKQADFEMEMYNADGSRSEMCGNGIRCVGKFVYDYRLTDKKQLVVESFGVNRYLDLNCRNGKVESVCVNMGAPELIAKNVPVVSENETVLDEVITVGDKDYRMTCVSMGNPHAVVFVDHVDQFPLESVGPLFEHHERFPKRVNAEFVEILDRKHVKMRVWERGTGETLACGTGCCATAVACISNRLTEDEITVILLGGELKIRWDKEKNCVYMTGPAKVTFEGVVQI